MYLVISYFEIKSRFIRMTQLLCHQPNLFLISINVLETGLDLSCVIVLSDAYIEIAI